MLILIPILILIYILILYNVNIYIYINLIYQSLIYINKHKKFEIVTTVANLPIRPNILKINITIT